MDGLAQDGGDGGEGLGSADDGEEVARLGDPGGQGQREVFAALDAAEGGLPAVFLGEGAEVSGVVGGEVELEGVVLEGVADGVGVLEGARFLGVVHAEPALGEGEGGHHPQDADGVGHGVGDDGVGEGL